MAVSGPVGQNCLRFEPEGVDGTGQALSEQSRKRGGADIECPFRAGWQNAPSKVEKEAKTRRMVGEIAVIDPILDLS